VLATVRVLHTHSKASLYQRLLSLLIDFELSLSTGRIGVAGGGHLAASTHCDQGVMFPGDSLKPRACNPTVVPGEKQALGGFPGGREVKRRPRLG